MAAKRVHSEQHAEYVPEYDTYGGERKLKQDVDQMICPSCGSTLKFDPEKQALACEHCGNSVEVAKFMAQERALDLSIDTNRKWTNETRVYSCAQCGAESVFPVAEFASNCPFCDSSAVTQIEDLEGVRPDSVIPFKISKETAGKSYNKWAKSRFFAPRAFRKEHSLDSMKALFTPSWTFDAQTASLYTGVVGDYYYVTVGSGKNRRTERRVRYRNVSGHHSYFFDDMLVNAGGQMNDSTFNKLLPYNLKGAALYDDKFLAGCHADHYKKNLRTSYQESRGKMDAAIRRQITSSLRCDTVSWLNINTRYSGETFKYLLLPVYVCTHAFKEKIYRFFVNGETGKISGKAPVSAGKVIGLVLGILVFVAAALFIAYYLQG